MDDNHVRAEISAMAAEGFLLTLDKLPEWVEQSRVRRGLDKSQVAKQMGMPRNTMWRFSVGHTVDTVTLRKILSWLGDESV